MRGALLLLALAWAAPLFAGNCDFEREDLLSRPAAADEPTPVTLRVYVNDIVAIRDAEQSFSSDVFVITRF